jgi:hypothetical protein
MDLEQRQQLAAQLRKGNYVYYEKPVHVSLGELFTELPGAVKLSTYGIHLVECDAQTIVHPILLTHALLSDFGFTRNKRKESILVIKIPPIGVLNITQIFVDTWRLSFCYSRTTAPIRYNIKYLHQLQNYFYFLSGGHELEFKKPEETKNTCEDTPKNITANPDYSFTFQTDNETAAFLKEFSAGKSFVIQNIHAFHAILKLLWERGYRPFTNGMSRESTGCLFSWEVIANYEDVLRFQLHWPE